MTKIKTVGIAGSGLIGAGWAARLLYRGVDVIAYDPWPGAEERLRAAVEVAWPAMQNLFPSSGKRGNLVFTHDVEAMASQADFIHEAAPEKIEVKRTVFQDLDQYSRPDVVIASSSSGYLPSLLQEECRRPERVMIGHPFNPVYILPLVELVAGKRTSEAAFSQAKKYFASLDMKVLPLKREIEGYICDRLQEALWREALHILNKDIGTTQDIDDALTYSAGMRWAFMGSFLTYHLAGGPGGMRDFVKHFHPNDAHPWTDLQYPSWNDTLERRLVEGCEAQAAGRSVAEIAAQRDAVLVDMIRVFEKHGVGAGTVLPARRG